MGVQLHRVGADRFPRVAVALDEVGDVAQMEVSNALHGVELLPLERHRHRRTREAAHAVRGDDGLRRAIAIDVDQDLVVALVLFNLERACFCIRGDKGLRDCFASMKNRIEVPLGLDGCHHVQSLAAGGLDEGVVAVFFELHAQPFADLGNERPRRSVGRVDIEHEIVRVVAMLGAAVHLVQLDARHVREPHQRRIFGRDHIIDGLLGVSDLHTLQPVRHPVGQILLEERLAVDAVRETDQRERTAANVR
jgi:hypothetical protein